MAYLLIIDDDEDFAGAVAAVLQSEGHETAIELDDRKAMDRLRQRRPDAIVLDVMFPENPSGGFELARKIRRSYDRLPILMLTAVNQQFPLGFSNKDIDPTWLPVTEFLEKPVDFQLLSRKVAQLLA
ncbi:MAG: response regulator [Pirellulales bacterium]|nr:response regulator [Pirellulales bacterium]